MTTDRIIVAGAAGDLGERIVRALVARGADVQALVRAGTDLAKIERVKNAGANAVLVDFADRASLARACSEAACVVSALNGLGDVIVETQSRLLDAATDAGVPRFIPSDFSLDYTGLPEGSNRNFDLRRSFRARVDRAPVRATSIFNGAFADMLAGQMPLIVRPLRRVLYWGSADQRFSLTTKDDTAAFTAAAALDASAPRDLHIAGTEASVRDLARLMTDVSGHRYRPMRAGSLKGLSFMIGVARRVVPQPGAVFPAWQGMQYFHNMFSGGAPSAPIDNDRYPNMRWTDLREVLSRSG